MELSQSVIDKVLDIRETFNVDIEILASISILLGEKEQAIH